MKRTLVFMLFGFVMGSSLHSTHSAASSQQAIPKASSQIQATRDFFSDLGNGRLHATAPYFNKVDWVDKECRTWAPDGDIDVDQTCLVVRNVSGSVSIIPNRYNDQWTAEISTQMAKPTGTKDKWISRFLEVRGW